MEAELRMVLERLLIMTGSVWDNHALDLKVRMTKKLRRGQCNLRKTRRVTSLVLINSWMKQKAARNED